MTPCDAELTFIHDINDPTNKKAKMTTKCCLFKQHHIDQKTGKQLKHLSLNVQATIDGEQYEGTEGWSFRLEPV